MLATDSRLGRLTCGTSERRMIHHLINLSTQLIQGQRKLCLAVLVFLDPKLELNLGVAVHCLHDDGRKRERRTERQEEKAEIKRVVPEWPADDDDGGHEYNHNLPSKTGRSVIGSETVMATAPDLEVHRR